MTINDKCGNTRCPDRYLCALQLKEDPGFEFHECGNWRDPEQKGIRRANKKKTKQRSVRAKARKVPGRRQREG